MTADRTGADLFVDALWDYGVEHVFGNPGTTELPLVDAIEGSAIEYVLTLHEDVAVGMAAGYACTSRCDGDERPLGVVNLHAVPGVAHGLANVYGANVGGAPLIVTAGTQRTGYRHERPILSGDTCRIVRQFCKSSERVATVDALPTQLRRAARTALTPPMGPVFLELPVDVQRTATTAPVQPLGTVPTPGPGDPEMLDEAAETLLTATDPVVVVGDHVARSGATAVTAAMTLAESIGARVHAEIHACEINFPTDHELWGGYIPPDADVAASMLETDTLLFLGCSTNTTVTAPSRRLCPREASRIDASNDPSMLGMRRRADVAILGDPGATAAALTERIDADLSATTRRRRYRRAAAAIEDLVGIRSALAGDRVHAGVPTAASVADALRRTVPSARIVDESITAKYTLLERYEPEPLTYCSNKGGGLGFGVPMALGAALAGESDDRPTIAFVGDGSYHYYPNALFTAARYDLDLTIVVVNNESYRILDRAHHEIVEDPVATLESTSLSPTPDIASNAASYGVSSFDVSSISRLESTLARASSTSGPSVVEVTVA